MGVGLALPNISRGLGVTSLSVAEVNEDNSRTASILGFVLVGGGVGK